MSGATKLREGGGSTNLDSQEIHRYSSISEENKYQTLYIGESLPSSLAQLSLDFRLDGLYYRVMDRNWITLSIGDKTPPNEIELINTAVKRDLLIRFISYALKAFPWIEEKHVKQLNILLTTLDTKKFSQPKRPKSAMKIPGKWK